MASSHRSKTQNSSAPAAAEDTSKRVLCLQIFCTLALLSAIAFATVPDEERIPDYRVSVMDGEDALNILESSRAHEPVLRVTDGTGHPLAGAAVMFDTPKAGPGALFPSGSTHLDTITNPQGFAIASGLRNNGQAGPFAILVHVLSQGKLIANLTLHQTNVSKDKEPSGASQLATLEDASTSSSVIGIVLGDQFKVNGAIAPPNANLAAGNRIQTQATPVTVYIHDQCEFLIGPQSSVTVQAHSLSVAAGAVRAKRFGDCKFGYGGLWVNSRQAQGDAVLSVSNQNLEIGSVSGPIEVANAVRLVTTVQTGTVSTFAFANPSNESGAAIGMPGNERVAFMVGVSAGASALSVGLARSAVVEPALSPTSP